MALLNEINVKGVPHPIVTDDGYYQEMTVGDAEQLVATTFTEDDAPYNFRTAGGAIDIGDRKQVEGLVGGTIAWNQRQPASGNISPYAGLTYTFANGKLTLSGTYSGAQGSAVRLTRSDIPVPVGHKVLFYGGTNKVKLRFQGNTAGIQPSGIISATEGMLYDLVYSMYYDSGEEVNDAIYPQCFDLTQMFGSTIADYLYNLQQTQPGAGVAWFKKLFPKPYYAYNAGELMSVKALRHITRGFNSWDEEWELGYYNVTTGEPATSSSNLRSKNFIPVVPNTSYYAKIPTGYIAICEYDADKNFIKCTQGVANRGITTTADTHFIRFHCTSAYGTTYNNDITINLSWDGERDGEYEEYVEHVYELDPDLELRGIPKLSAGNDLYYDGDIYEPDGTVTRKYVVVDLGNITFTRDEIGGNYFFYRALTGTGGLEKAKFGGGAIDVRHINVAVTTSWASVPDRGMLIANSASYPVLYIRDDAYTDAAAFKTAMSGVYLVYELAESTEESADPYNGTQIVDDFGTEEFVDAGVAAEDRDVAIPVGHNSLYQPNLRAKLEMVPEAPEDEGYYVVYHHNGINEYVPLIIPQELPELPSEDGTYTLKCTVTEGAATLSFESEV